MNTYMKEEKKMAKLLCIALQLSLKAIAIFFLFLKFHIGFFLIINNSIYPLESNFSYTSLPM